MLETNEQAAPISKRANFWSAFRYWAKEYFGENEYERYVTNWKAMHQGSNEDDLSHGQHCMMSPKEFYQYRLQVKYSSDMKRCC